MIPEFIGSPGAMALRVGPGCHSKCTGKARGCGKHLAASSGLTLRGVAQAAAVSEVRALDRRSSGSRHVDAYQERHLPPK